MGFNPAMAALVVGAPTAKTNLNPPASLGGLVSSREGLIKAPSRRGGRGRLRIAEPEVVEEVHGQPDEPRDEAFVRVEAAQLIKALGGSSFPPGVRRDRNLDHAVARLSERLRSRRQ